MEAVVSTEPVDVDAGFRRWNNDLHRSEVVVWTDREQVSAVLEDRRRDGTVLLAVEDARSLDALAGGGRLALRFRADEGRGRRRIAPIVTDDYSLDRAAGRVRARFTVDIAAERQYLLPEPVAGTIGSRLLFRRAAAVRVVRLSPYGGELALDDLAAAFAPGMVAALTLWLPWTGEMRLQVQLTGYREELGGRFTFRVVDRSSMRAAAIILVGTVDDFHFEGLRIASVAPARMTRYLTVRTVSDDATFEQALGLRLLGNRNFGRLAEVADEAAVADHLDPHSVNFVVLLGLKAVGAGRVVVNDGDRSLSEIETETVGLPDRLWDGGFVEVSRVVVHPDYRSAGVIIALFREVARLAFKLECRHLVLDAIEKLVPIYERIGAKRLSITKTHPYSRETVQVMSIDVGEQLGRMDRRSLNWQYVFGPVLRHHLDTSAAQPLGGLVRGAGHVPYWIKRTLSRVP